MLFRLKVDFEIGAVTGDRFSKGMEAFLLFHSGMHFVVPSGIDIVEAGGCEIVFNVYDEH
jgi:hypothetical protein